MTTRRPARWSDRSGAAARIGERRRDQDDDGRDRAWYIRMKPQRYVPAIEPIAPQKYTSPIALPALRACSTAILATTGPTIPSTVAGTRKSSMTTSTVRSSQLTGLGPGTISPTLAFTQSEHNREQATPARTTARRPGAGRPGRPGGPPARSPGRFRPG